MAKANESNMEIDTPIEIVDIPTTPENGAKVDVVEEKKKPTKKKKKKVAIKPSTPAIGTNEISALIQATFSLVALKGGEHWNITTDEADSVAKPLSNILQKMDLLEKVSNVSDGVALTIAVVGITLPRVIISKQLIDSKKGAKFDGIRTKREVNESSGDPTDRIEDNGGVQQSQSSDGEFIQNLSITPSEQTLY